MRKQRKERGENARAFVHETNVIPIFSRFFPGLFLKKKQGTACIFPVFHIIPASNTTTVYIYYYCN